jgi:hypothetical protein
LHAFQQRHPTTPTNRPQHASGLYGTLDWMYDPVGNRIYELADAGGTTTESLTDTELPDSVANSVRGTAIDELRRMAYSLPKERVTSKGFREFAVR